MTGKQLKQLARRIPATAFDIVIKDRRGTEVFFTVPVGTAVKGAAQAPRAPIYAEGIRYRMSAD